jgi:DNA-binding transcriptional MerR regulator
MYTIKKVAEFANVSKRTLRHYDSIGLLKPSKLGENGYRYYSDSDIDQLQQIMFYKTMGFSLSDIKNLLYDEEFDRKRALIDQLTFLEGESMRIQTLIQTVKSSIDAAEGRKVMTNKDKFEGFKQGLIEENEELYGKEAREKFGKSVDASNQKLANMSYESFNDNEELKKEMEALFVNAMQLGIDSEDAKKASQMHEKWIKNYWTSYSKDAHRGLVEMYVLDERFKAYYEKLARGLAEFVRDAVTKYLETS